ncbi:MalY/PatB family protein [Bradyrhizobium sp. AUGA SZCCT0160]|uniref:MalY/PatB family protein n=1 Tax=Bradyrhizobium sp. AUGA SZCCT0160 TaxID=2807662 RepID=UPI001BA83F40|nr:MalY/PatB family protein [Bradyrhizobium sp. AUGA SZCCT0160]MBR1194091.1 pyridoxal phosphate-dependent aminotransferase [Bradyrhizobium sp. AUGA SZCCT0160]
MFDFDRVINRRGTHASKWDMMAKNSGITAADGIPMWVADMDFAAPPGVTEALSTLVTRGVHGYYADTGSWAAALAEWMARRHDLAIDPAWVSPTPGVVSGLGLILQAVTEVGDEVVVFPPAYHAFRKIILANERRILDAQLVQRQGRYEMDLDALGKQLTPKTKIVFFCSPHNPGGTVWSSEEIRALAAFCAERNLILVSDEIHCDLLLGGVKHTPTLSAAPEIADRLITCLAATKTFNLAGAHVGACVTSNPVLKQRIDARIAASGLASYNAFGMIATEAAWRTGEAWLDALLPYLAGNRDTLTARIENAAPGARSMRLDATYLAWVDFSGTGLAAADVAARVKDRARIFASPGEQFGPGGETWLRFNFATPRPILNEALDRLDDAFRDLRA